MIFINAQKLTSPVTSLVKMKIYNNKDILKPNLYNDLHNDSEKEKNARNKIEDPSKTLGFS